MVIFVVNIFLSAFLLFQIQPMIGKFILPWFGGTPAVWSTVMLFFQVLLTGGYAYAYWLIRHTKRQKIIHISLIALSFILLTFLSFTWKSPITPDASWKPQDIDAPIFNIFKLLIVSVGLPYFLLASNSPLMQAWFSRSFPSRSYARLYSLSNVGSLLGLLLYPTLIEPSLPLQNQGWMWCIGFAVFGLLTAWITIRSERSAVLSKPEIDPVSSTVQPSLSMFTLWIALSATASLFLLSVTNQISQEVAVIPFLWILPLVLYLLSFILTFSGERAYNRKLYSILFVILALLAIFVMSNIVALHIYFQIFVYCGLLFSACMLCHGELYLFRPEAEHLTSFYLMVSVGGAVGGIFVSLVAPMIFTGYWEFFVGLMMTVAILMTALRGNRPAVDRARFVFFVFILMTTVMAVTDSIFSNTLYVRRNFYGIVRVREQAVGIPPHNAYLMAHGITVHGVQFILPDERQTPTAYYARESGVASALLNHPHYGKGMRVGILGAGIGTLVTYGQRGDSYRLYEINPAVVDLAEGEGGFFSFIKDTPADVTMVVGDARIALERELAENGSQNFDLLALDAFSSDSIPVHLLTKEAFGLYLHHMAPDGIIAVNVTNRYLDPQPIVWQLAQYYGLYITRIDYGGASSNGYPSFWILLSRDPALLKTSPIQERSINLDNYSTNLKMWTDDYSNLFQILK